MRNKMNALQENWK